MKKTVVKVLTAIIISANTIIVPAQAFTINQGKHMQVSTTQDPRGLVANERHMLMSTQDPRG
ncbi:hypothetical protein [Clostridium tagluense]|uniref:hypothetical protein n=1 Tax=Clostridium tagluense TaxID=360422 RepID=UPI001CF1ADDB|nr:hypothetical protein [Clostridium tagluense]MCB2300437.1 hypothetical protein [Clostridium tagluense]